MLASHQGLWSPHGADWFWLPLFIGWMVVFGGAMLASLLIGLFGKDRD